MIRRANAGEADALAQLHAQAFDDPWDAAAIRGFIESIGVIALRGEAGFILVRALAGEAEILTLAVAPAQRRRGLGRALVDAGAEAARAGGAEAMFLEVAADNLAAIALYDAAGFVRVGRRSAYYRRAGGAVMDALVLRKALTLPPA